MPRCNFWFIHTLNDSLEHFKKGLTGRANTLQHVSTTISRVSRVIRGCKCFTVSDVSASKVQRFIADRRKEKAVIKTVKQRGASIAVTRVKQGISATSFNYYLRDSKSFFTWMVGDKMHENPLSALENINTRTDRRHDRRALSPDELRWFLNATNSTVGECYGMTGPERSMLYRLAAETGLRAGELRSLTRASFRLGEDPAVTITAAYAKNRRQDTLPLRAGTVALLTDHLI